MENEELQKRIETLEMDLKALNEEVYRNNFTATQDFNKASSFTTKLKVPHFNELPTTGEVGDIIELSGKLYICSSANVYSLVGTQS